MCKLIKTLLIIILIVSCFEAVCFGVEYFSRSQMWNIADTGDPNNSGRNANSQDSMWSYEFVPVYGFDAAGDWWTNPSVPLNWNDPLWQHSGLDVNVPNWHNEGITNENYLEQVPVVLWKCPREGFLTVAGNISFNFAQTGKSSTVKLVIGRKQTSTIEIFVEEIITSSSDFTLDLAVHRAELQNILIQQGESIFISYRVKERSDTTAIELNDSAVTFGLSALSIDDDEDMDMHDFALLGRQWMQVGCGKCNKADLTGDGNVNIYDIEVMASNWLE